MKFRRIRILPMVLAAACCGVWLSVAWPGHAQETPAGSGAEPPPPAVVQEKIREWVRVKKQIAEERADWAAEQRSLADLNELRRKEIGGLDEIIAAAGSRLADAEKQRDELAAEEEALRQKRALLETGIAQAEEALRALIPRFPEPLRVKANESLARLESPDPEAPLQNRYRDLLVILGEAGAFDHAITVAAELREIGGRQVEVEALYLGLSRAWYVDRDGRHAGTGIPGAAGWTWTENPAAAPPVRRAIAMHRKEAAPGIVSLPFPAVKP